MIIRDVFWHFKSLGFKKTIMKIFLKTFYYFSLKRRNNKIYVKNLLKMESVEEKFTKIYDDHYWINDESRSGTGSSLSTTKNIQTILPKIFDKFFIKKIFDAPCGDFNWMFHVLKNNKIDYLGADIVDNLIILNKKKYENNKIKFSKLDIRFDKLPKSDMMICRDCLFHFSYDDIYSFFNNFISSEIKYILITSHLNDVRKFNNRDIITADFRLIDFFSEPFNFKKNYIYTFDDRENEIQNFKQMYLFTREQIKDNLKKNPETFRVND